jgi:SNF2 family DNA or RNA helicase
VINGQTPSAKRQAHVDAFQNAGPGFDVMVLAPRAAGVGLTLTAANHVIHLSRWWNPAVEDQCNDRVYRIGQDKPVTVYCPMSRHPAIGDQSFDLKLNDLLSRKRSMSQSLLVPQESDSDYTTLFEETISG